MSLSSLTLALGFLILISATFARQVLDFLCGIFGKGQVGVGLGGLFILLALLALVYINKAAVSKRRKCLFFIVLCWGLFISWQQRLFPERIHMIEYGFLGWMAGRDLLKDRIDIGRVIQGLAIIVIFSCLDELLQWALPYRTGDLRDVGFNLAGGLGGIALFFIKSGKNFYLDRRG